MKLIKPSFEIWNQPAGLEGVYKQIERVGRVCYKSEDRITEDSAKPFVDRIIKSGHGAMLEHGTIYLLIPQINNIESCNPFYTPFTRNKYSKEKIIKDFNENRYAAVSTNMRVIIENNLEDYLQYICEPTKYHEKRVTVRFICDRGVSHEFVRHRVFSFAQESTRYCNYSKGKFGNELTFIIPCWLDYAEQQFTDKDDSSIRTDLSENEYFIDLLLEAENTYNYLVQYCGWTPQQARAILPNALKTELIVTGFVSDWNHFFDLRARGTTGAPHPQAKELAEPLMKEFIARKYINN